jgi:DNA topoisomerase-2
MPTYCNADRTMVAKRRATVCLLTGDVRDRFGMDSLDSDAVALMTKRVYDMAGSTAGIKVYLNGEKLPIKSFLDYVKLFVQAQSAPDRAVPLPLLHQKFGKRWEVAVSLSDGQFSQVSFVNSIATIRGGTHVNHVTDQLTRHLASYVNRTKKTSLKPFQVKQHIWIFVNCLIENPAFDSQTKCTLTTKAEAFGSSCDLDKRFLSKVQNCGVVDSIMAWSRYAVHASLWTPPS